MGHVKVFVQEVSKDFITKEKMAVEALRNVSFNVSEQEFLYKIEPNGCGKTTLLA